MGSPLDSVVFVCFGNKLLGFVVVSYVFSYICSIYISYMLCTCCCFVGRCYYVLIYICYIYMIITFAIIVLEEREPPPSSPPLYICEGLLFFIPLRLDLHCKVF